jgi:Tfp pilus assembly protein PilF
MRGKFRWKVILVLGLAGCLAGVGWFFLHRYQVRRLNSAFLEQADRAEQDGQPERAARFLRQFLLISQSDVDVMDRYGQLLEKLTPNNAKAGQDALALYEKVLVQEPGRTETRRRAAGLAFKLRRPKVALGHLKELEDRYSVDADTKFLAGQCCVMTRQYAEAEEHYKKAIDLDKKREPKRIEIYAHLVDLYAGPLNKPKDAEGILGQMVVNVGSFQAYLVQANFLQSKFLKSGNRKDLEGAEDSLETARNLAPKEPDVLVVSGTQRLLEAGAAKDAEPNSKSLEEAREFLRKAADGRPGDPRVYLQLAQVELSAGRADEAIAALEAGAAKKEVTGPGRKEILFELAELLATQGKLDRAKEVIGDLQKLRRPVVPQAEGDYLQARILVAEQKWPEAAALLERVRPQLPKDSKLPLKANLLLGRCFEQMGDGDRQLAAFTRASQIEPLNGGSHLGLTTALLNQGRLKEAIDECRQVLQMKNPPASAYILLAQMLAAQTSKQDPKQARWEPVDEAIKRAEEAIGKSVEIEVLRAEVAAAKGDKDAEDRLRKVCKEEYPKEASPWVALAILVGREKGRAEALQTLEEAGKALGDVAELRLARLRFTPPAKEEALVYLAPLAAGLDQFGLAARVRLVPALAAAYDQAGEPALAEKLLAPLVENAGPGRNDVRLLMQLFELHVKTQNQDGIDRTLKAIRRIDGANGPLGHYAEAYALIARWQRGETGLAGQAKAHLQAAAEKRRSWAQIPLALATIAELERDVRGQIQHLHSALELGDRQLAVVHQLAKLHLEQGEVPQAQEVIDRFQQSGAQLSGDLQRLQASLSFVMSQPERAVEQARAAVKKGSNDSREHLWLALILARSDHPDDHKDAENAFKKSIELSKEKDLDSYVAFAQFYARHGEEQEAKGVMDDMRKKFPATQLALPLAACFEALEKPAEAERLYEEGLKARPDDIKVIQVVADYYQTHGQPRKAEPLLRRILLPALNAPPAEAAWARRNLAMALVLTEGAAQARAEALALVDENLKAPPPALEDQLAKGIVLACFPERRAEAIALLEKAFKQKSPSPDQEYVLAQLYDVVDDWPKTRARMLDVINSATKRKHDRLPLFLADFTTKLLDHKELDSAKLWLDRRVEVRPNDLAAAALLARYEIARNNGANAIRVVRQYAAEKDSVPKDDEVRWSLAAGLLEELAVRYAGTPAKKDALLKDALLDAAEELLRRSLEQSKKPGSRLALAAFLGRCQKLGEALEQCDEALKKGAPPEQVALVAVAALSVNDASPEEFARVENCLKAARQKDPGKLELVLFEASLRERQGRYKDAEALYRKLLAQKPGNAVVANNLAFLLGLQGRGEEALSMIQAVIDKVGPVGELLDSRAAILLSMGKYAEAEKDLAEALRQERNVGRLFHRAQVRLAAGQEKGAAEAFQEATKLGLHAAMLHPLERSGYEEMKMKLLKLANQKK